MPELPDVEVLKQYLDATSLHQEIGTVEVKSDKILNGITKKAIKKRLKGLTLESTARHGKYLFVKIDEGPWLVIHFGMTGDLKYWKNVTDGLLYDQLRINFTNGYRLAYISKRKLGKIGIVVDPHSFVRERKLGPDALDIGLTKFKDIMGRARGSIKSTLMNQKLIAGIGNIYSDEILFQSGVHPLSIIGFLDDCKIRELFQKMKSVFRTAIKHRANPDEFPASYLLKDRNEGAKCPKCDGSIERIKISGRSSYYCPKCQTELSK